MIDRIKGWHRIEINKNNIDDFLKLVPVKTEM